MLGDEDNPVRLKLCTFQTNQTTNITSKLRYLESFVKLGKSEVPRKLFVLKNRKAQKTKKGNPDDSTRIEENQTKRERIDTICQEWGDIAEDFGETNKNALLGQLAEFGRGIAEGMTG